MRQTWSHLSWDHAKLALYESAYHLYLLVLRKVQQLVLPRYA